MGFILSIFRDLNSESSNMEMHYSHLYFKDENKELLEYGFCYKISIYKDRAKKKSIIRDAFRIFLYVGDKIILLPTKMFR